MDQTVEQKLQTMGLVLPPILKTRGSFVPYVMSGNLLFLSGKGAPVRESTGSVPKVGADVSVSEAQAHARDIGLYLLALMREALGDFSRVKRVVKLLGMVNATPDFVLHTEVINGCSDLFLAVFGERGAHARSAIGVASLPKGFAVEIEAIVEFE